MFHLEMTEPGGLAFRSKIKKEVKPRGTMISI